MTHLITSAEASNRLIGLPSPGDVPCLLLSCLAGSSIKPDAEGTGDTRKEYEDEKNTAKAYERTAELLSDQIRDINRKIAETTLEIEDLNGEINVLDLEIEDAEKLYFEYADGMIVEKEKINKVVKLLYENSVSEDEIATILQSEDISMVLNREEYLNGISNYYNEAVSEYNDMLVEAQEKESELNNLRLDREAEIIELEKKQQEMSADIKELGEVMAEAKKKSWTK